MVAGNWKMNQQLAVGKALVKAILAQEYPLKSHQEVVFAPPFIHLPEVADLIHQKENHFLSAQNCHQESSGAYTGEVSADMLKSTQVDYVILGHSERRQYFNEGPALLAQKVDTALAAGLKVIFCVGESLELRETGQHNDYVGKQVADSLFHLPNEAFAHLVLAYEPIWAIGTGKTASKEQAQAMHAHIRQVVATAKGAEVADTLPILYGGSVKPDNAIELFAQADVDGGLIGGASLKADDFVAIIKAMS